MHMQIRSKALVLLASALMLTAVGCDKLKKKKKGKKGKRIKTSKAMKRTKANGRRMRNKKKHRAATDAHRRSQPGYTMSVKVGHYIQCTNNMSPAIDRSAKRYFSWAKDNPKRVPSKRIRIVYGLYSINSNTVKRCNKALNTVPETPETPKLTTAGAAYQKAVTAVVPLVATAYAYYSKQTYKTDGMKTAASLHPKLVQAFKSFHAADRALRTEISEISDRLEAERLARMKTKGANFWYYKALTQYQSKLIVRLVTPIDRPKDFDVKAFNKLSPGFINTLKVFTMLRKNDPDAKRWRHLGNFVRSLQAYAVQLDKLYARATGKLKYSSTDKFHLKTKHAYNIKGHPEAVVKAYNNMIAVLNRR